MRYVWPPLAKILDERKVLIDQGIRNAEQAEADKKLCDAILAEIELTKTFFTLSKLL
mgnify:CR=1 FL=1